MRKILIALVIVIVLAAIWLWRGRDLSTLADRFKTIETSSRSINALTYEGAGTGGILHVDGTDLSLNEVELGGTQPSVGTTKDGQLALSFAGKVFPFGSALSRDERLSANVPSGDAATIAIEHSAIPWPNFFETNWMTGRSPTWKRHIYQKLTLKKPTGAKLEMLWRYEEYFYSGDGWTGALMTRPGWTGLIRVEISGASR
jgi:hypothetical protein